MIDINTLDWAKGNGILPAIVQDAQDLRVLMLGYMNQEALAKTLETGYITFFSRSKQRLWVKGETSGNALDFVSMDIDCDRDTILIKSRPHGPVCHTGTPTCFGDNEDTALPFLGRLFSIIKQRNQERPEGSYTTKLFEAGKSRIAQKVGEEGVELSLAHIKGDKDEILNESADLLFHIMVLLEDAELNIIDVCKILKQRHIG